MRDSHGNVYVFGVGNRGGSADIANGAPTGTDATNQIVLTWADGAQGLNHEQLLLMSSTDGGASFTGPASVPLPGGDRPYYTAPAISPDGTDAYISYDAFTTQYRTDTTSSRGFGRRDHARGRYQRKDRRGRGLERRPQRS